MTGLGAAMAFHRLEVADELMRRKADPAKGQKGWGDKFSSAVEVGVIHGFWQGVDRLTGAWNVPLWTRMDRPANDLLFFSIPAVISIHNFRPDSDPHDIAAARALDSRRIENGLKTFDYLVCRHNLDIQAVNEQGKTLLSAAIDVVSGFYGDDGRVLRHLLKQGCDPNQECIPAQTPSVQIIFSEKAEEALAEIAGEDVVDFLGEDKTAQRAQFETTPLIYACYIGHADLAAIYLEDGRTDPLYADHNGHDAFAALEAGRRESSRPDSFDRIYSLMIAKVQNQRGNVVVFSQPRPH